MVGALHFCKSETIFIDDLVERRGPRRRRRLNRLVRFRKRMQLRAMFGDKAHPWLVEQFALPCG